MKQIVNYCNAMPTIIKSLYFDSAPPEFASSAKPVVAEVTGSSVKVSWPKAMKITPGVEAHYHYIVWIKSGTESEKNVSQVQQGTDREWMEVQITGLAFNTKYALRVEPYRVHNGKQDAGDSTGSVVFTTSGVGCFLVFNYQLTTTCI